MWTIDKDHIGANRVGTTGETVNIGIGYFMPEFVDLPKDSPAVRFRMRDDDGEIYYGGWLNDDEECLNQQAALEFGTKDAGCTTIEVKRKGKWVQDIG